MIGLAVASPDVNALLRFVELVVVPANNRPKVPMMPWLPCTAAAGISEVVRGIEIVIRFVGDGLQVELAVTLVVLLERARNRQTEGPQRVRDLVPSVQDRLRGRDINSRLVDSSVYPWMCVSRGVPNRHCRRRTGGTRSWRHCGRQWMRPPQV